MASEEEVVVAAGTGFAPAEADAEVDKADIAKQEEKRKPRKNQGDPSTIEEVQEL